MSGYARIHRSLLGHPAFRNESEAMAFAWLAVRASWRSTRVRYKGRVQNLERGQLAISVRDFAEAMDRDKGWVERLLKRLRTEAMVTTVTETGVLVITICNYEKYQGSASADKTVEETPARQEQDTEQEPEEGKKEEIVEATPQPVVSASDVRQALDSWNAACAKTAWARVIKFTPSRQAALRARLRDDGPEGWADALARAAQSPLLAAQPPPTWFDFDFIVKPGNFAKLIEGKYDRQFSRNGSDDRGIGRSVSASLSVFGAPERQAYRSEVAEPRRIGSGAG